MLAGRARAAGALTLVFVAVTACEVSSEGPRDREDADTAVATEGTHAMMATDEAESIARGVRQRVTAILQSGAQAASDMPAVYTRDAVLSDESETTYAGNTQIARAFAQGMPPGATIDIRSTGALGSGDLVVDMGNYTVRMPNPQGGAPVSMNGRYLVVLQRMSDGSWKIVRQVTDVVGIGGAIPGGPPVDTSAAARPDTAAAARPESGFAPNR